MEISSTSRVSVQTVQETDFGVIPSVGNHRAMRVTGITLKPSQQFEDSMELRDDRQISDTVNVGENISGGLNFELSYREFDEQFAAALQGTWSVFGADGIGAVIPTSATFAASTLTAGAATSGSSLFTLLRPGQWVKVGGSSIAGQNAVWAQVSKTVVPTNVLLTFEGTPFTGLTGNGGTGVFLTTSILENGVTQRSYSIQQTMADINQFIVYRGCTVSKFTLDMKPKSKITGSFEYMGRDNVRSGVNQLPGTRAPSRTFDILNTSNNVGDLRSNGVPITDTYVRGFTLSIDNSLRARDALGMRGAASLGSGTAKITGTIEVYFTNGALYDKVINNTALSLSISVKDGSGNGYVIEMGKIKLTDIDPSASQIDQDIMLNIPFRALMDTTTGKTISINRIGVV